MKFLSALLMFSIIFLSSFSGMVKNIEPAGKHDCCKNMAGKMACNNKKTDGNNGCDKPYCNMMLSCSACGFIIVETLHLQPGFANYASKPIPLYKIGDLSAYTSSNWKPPKTC